MTSMRITSSCCNCHVFIPSNLSFNTILGLRRGPEHSAGLRRKKGTKRWSSSDSDRLQAIEDPRRGLPGQGHREASRGRQGPSLPSRRPGTRPFPRSAPACLPRHCLPACLPAWCTLPPRPTASTSVAGARCQRAVVPNCPARVAGDSNNRGGEGGHQSSCTRRTVHVWPQEPGGRVLGR